ncbi:hypothetical protein SAMN04488574_102212 [Bacillus sp. 71mf]|nr:hypothetical protein SAMN04488574_102212 [Bacillus sp. 71mf]SFS39607.1 hypothetical protein SAMN04488145_101254 [Bacillus sp. 103mf]
MMKRKVNKPKVIILGAAIIGTAPYLLLREDKG